METPEPAWANPRVPHPVTEVPPPLLLTSAKGEMTGPSTRSKVSEGGNPEMPMIRSVAGSKRFWIPGQARNDGLGAGKIHKP